MTIHIENTIREVIGFKLTQTSRSLNMKNLVCLMLLLSSSLSIAQIQEKGSIEFTPIIGYSTSYHIHSFLLGSSPVSGFQIGVYGDYFLNDRWSLRSGLLYQRMGAEKNDFPIVNNEYSEKTKYLTLPFVAL